MNTEKDFTEDIVDFSDDRDNGKVELKRDSNGEIYLFNNMMTTISGIHHYTF